MNLNAEKPIYPMKYPNSGNAADFFVVATLQDFLTAAYEVDPEETGKILFRCREEGDATSLVSDIQSNVDVYFADSIASLSLVDRAIIRSSSNFCTEEDIRGLIALDHYGIVQAVRRDAEQWLSGILGRVEANASNIVGKVHEAIADTQYGSLSVEQSTPSTSRNRMTIKQDLDTYRELRERASTVSMVDQPLGSQYIDERCGAGLGNIEVFAFSKFDALMSSRYPTLQGMEQNDIDSVCDEPSNWSFDALPCDDLPIKEFLTAVRERAIELNTVSELGM